MKPARSPRRALHGALLLDKPSGWTSNDALLKVKGLLRAEKAGHTGTLDPLATGLLPLAFGAATKFAQASLNADKRYLATLRLGQRTSTGDGEGEVVEERPVDADLAAVAAALRRFTGAIDQLPPMHSALKHEGRALYEYARAGVSIEREARRVTVHRIEVVEFKPPRLLIDVSCSKGTYIRTLAEDIGEVLGCGAHLAALRRTRCGALALADAVTIEQLEQMGPAAREACLLPVDRLLAAWPEVDLALAEAERFLRGQPRAIEVPDAPALRVYCVAGGRRSFVGSARAAQGRLLPVRLLSAEESAALGAHEPRDRQTCSPGEGHP